MDNSRFLSGFQVKKQCFLPIFGTKTPCFLANLDLKTFVLICFKRF
jgi:hypothetical protein